VPGFLNHVIDDYLASPDTAVLLPADLHALARGQWAKIIAKRGLASAISAAAAPTQLQMITIRCGDAWAAMNPALVAQQARLSLFTPPMAAEAAWQQKLCALWPHDRGVSGVVRSNVPVVFVNGTADPADPPANVAAAPRTMPNALLVTVPGGSHPGRQARQPGQLGNMHPRPAASIPGIPARTITPRTVQPGSHHRPGRGEVASDQVAGQAVRPAT
jgi:hypothetical protein